MRRLAGKTLWMIAVTGVLLALAMVLLLASGVLQGCTRDYSAVTGDHTICM